MSAFVGSKSKGKGKRFFPFPKLGLGLGFDTPKRAGQYLRLAGSRFLGPDASPEVSQDATEIAERLATTVVFKLAALPTQIVFDIRVGCL